MSLNRYVSFAFKSFIFFSAILLVGCFDFDIDQAKKSEAVEQAFRYDNQVTVPDRKKIKTLLSNGDYKDAETILHSVQEEYEHGGNEYAVFKAYEIFTVNDEVLLEYLNKWVAHSPGAYVANAARGIYLVSQGWRHRGSKFINKTSTKQIDGMRESNYKAAIDLDKALKLNPRFLPAYQKLLEVGMNSFGHEFLDKVFNAAMQQNPNSFYIYSKYIYANEPKWGGSYQKLESIADEAQKHLDQNPRLYNLRAQKYIALGNSKSSDKEYKEAIEYYSKALKYGPGLYCLYRRAKAYGRINETIKQFADLNLLLDIDPYYVNGLEARAGAYQKQRKFDEARIDFEKIISIEPDNKWSTNSLGWIYQNMREYQKAAIMLEQTLKYHPKNKYALIQLGWTYNRLTQYEKAIPILEKRLELTPDDAKAWLYYADAQIDTNNPDGKQSLQRYLELVDHNNKDEKATIEKAKEYLKTHQ